MLVVVLVDVVVVVVVGDIVVLVFVGQFAAHALGVVPSQ